MNVRTVPNLQRLGVREKKTPRKTKYLRSGIIMLILGVLIWATGMIAGASQVSADSNQPEIRSAAGDYCIDDYHGSTKPGAVIDAWQCNGTTSQAWVFSNGRIMNQDKYCLSNASGRVVLKDCSSEHNQSWARDGVGFSSTDGNCLYLTNGQAGKQLSLQSCGRLSSVNESWTPDVWPGAPLKDISSPNCQQTGIGERVACLAKKQWLAWQTEPSLRPFLLNDYTDGNSYEEWCADFVSYIYNEAGVPFSGGERGNGWDEYNANNIRYMGFRYHAADSGYVPMPGDVAYFNYSGGHVEIVVTGGKHPTFIYGDSGTVDPVTNNGDMAENQITSDGQNGQLMYYLSPR